MPRSRKRPGHHYQKPADIPASQRSKGRITMAVLFGVFGLLITLFAANGDIIIVAVVTVVAAILGYVIGKNMEREASHK
jgi:hypothetical protein